MAGVMHRKAVINTLPVILCGELNPPQPEFLPALKKLLLVSSFIPYPILYSQGETLW